ncbi:retrovirus-related pol polyprotein from transposon TNT 1-94, partial [Tanacetum coccineum]
IGNVTISRVYYVEGLGHNLFSVRQFCDSNLEVAFRQHTCFIRNLEGVDLLTGSQGNNLYTLSLRDMMASSPICLLSKASKTKSWLWHRCLSHLNFGAINHLARHGLVREAVATACYTQNCSIIRLRHGKTPYELLHDKPLDLLFLHVFGALCYLTNDSENLDFDELTAMASERSSSGPALHEMTPATISSGLVPNPSPSTPFVPPSRTDWDILFQPLFDELLTSLPSVDLLALEVIAPIDEVVSLILAVSTGSPYLTTVDQDAPSPSNSQTTPETQPPIIPKDVEEDNHDIEVAHMGNDPYFGIIILEDHPLENIISELARPVSTRLQLHEQALFYYYDAFLTAVEPKTYKDALTQSCWIEVMHEELNEFERLKVWELVPRPDKVMVITLKWIYKVKLDELGAINTPMVEKSKLDEDKEGKAVDPSHYRGMIGTLLYFIASRPDLQFCICMFTRYQARPIEKHLHAIKRIFRYLRGTINRGLWYPKDSSIAIIAFANVDHAGCQATRRSTSGSM